MSDKKICYGSITNIDNISPYKEIGGKAKGLILLQEANQNIPKTLIIPGDVLDNFFQYYDNKALIESLYQALYEDKIEDALLAAHEIRTLIGSITLSPSFKKDIENALSDLKASSYAVRSSASNEDSQNYSWAGQFESYLSVTQDAVIENIKKCWQSAFSDRVIDYSWKTGHSISPHKISVIIQEMIQADFAGVTFTCHPSSGQENIMLAEFCRGNGEKLVSGAITPSQIMYNKKTASIVSITTQQNFSKDWISEFKIFLGSLVKLENQMRNPCDIEWVYKDGTFYLVQCRPITTEKPINSPQIKVGEEEFLLHVSRNMSVFHTFLMMVGHKEHFEDFSIATSLNFFSIIADGKNRTLAYIEKNSQKEYEETIKKHILNNKQFTKIQAAYYEGAKELILKANELDQVPSASNFIHFKEEYCKYSAGLSLSILAGNSLHKELLSLLEKDYPGNLSAEKLSVMTLTERLSPYQKARRDMLEIGVLIQTHKNVDVYQYLDSWLEKYRHIPVNFCEVPWTLTDAKNHLKEILAKDCKEELIKINLKDAENKASKQHLFDEIKNPDIHALASRLQELTYINEYRKEVFCQASLSLHKFLKFLARSHNMASWHTLFGLFPDEIYMLSKRDVSVLGRLKNRKLLSFSIDENNCVRHSEYLPIQTQATSQKASGEIKINGYSGNSGTYKGNACLVKGSQDFYKLKERDVLVAPMTSVDFAPLFEKIKAIVTDEGGITCHAAVIARERNIPCVIGTKIATTEIKDNALVLVDGTQGIVTVKNKARKQA